MAVPGSHWEGDITCAVGSFQPTHPPKSDLGRRIPLSCLPEEAVNETIKTMKQNGKSSERMEEISQFYQCRHFFVSQEPGRMRGWKTRSN